MWLRAEPLCPPAARFDLLVSYVTFVPRETVTYSVNPTSITVTYDSGDPLTHRHLLQAVPTKEQVRHFHGVLKALPLDSLRSSYSRDDVDDGFQLVFSVQVDDRPQTRVTMNNAWQPDLRQLCLELNMLLPEKLRIMVPKAGVGLPTNIELEAIDDTSTVDN